MKIQNNYFAYTGSVVKKYYTNRKTIKKSKHVSIKKKKEETNPLNLFILRDQYNERFIRFVIDIVLKVLFV